ncbi:hypothetical protein DYQ86_16665 [Acidobacteria bacterium AB60]|nr:hypothetical protein DYQ86_16665 [Acidobacteria bacterium AB60]
MARATAPIAICYGAAASAPSQVRSMRAGCALALICVIFGAGTVCPQSASAASSPAAPDPLVRSAISKETAVLKEFRRRSPLVETYVQNLPGERQAGQLVSPDFYSLNHFELARAHAEAARPAKPVAARTTHGSDGDAAAIQQITRTLGLESALAHHPLGFLELASPDPSGFGLRNYRFRFVRREFLGSVRTRVFDVGPRVPQNGRFQGRIWIEDQGGFIVRWSGTFLTSAGEGASPYVVHFDSWRLNLRPGIWLPVEIYVEQEPVKAEDTQRSGLKGQIRFWGYSLSEPKHETGNVEVSIDSAMDRAPPDDASPLQAQREWVTQTEDNVLNRLQEAGLIAPKSQGGIEDTLEQIVVNLSVPNNLNVPGNIQCRVILTDTLEATTVGNAILISKGLVDAMPNEPAFASAIALELAHIALGHRVNTAEAFNDRLLFARDADLLRLHLNHSEADNEAAQRRAIEYLRSSLYKDKLGEAGVFWEALADRAKVLPALTTPVLGDSLLRPDGKPWLAALAEGAPKIHPEDLAQIEARPLGSMLKTDPWSDSVHMLSAGRYAPMSPAEKMPLEITPIYFNLARYESDASLGIAGDADVHGWHPGVGPQSLATGKQPDKKSTPKPRPRPEVPGKEGGTAGERPN